MSSSRPATPASREGKISDSSPVMVKALRSAPRVDRLCLPQARRQFVEALPQRCGDRDRLDDAAVFGPCHLQMRAADVEAGDDWLSFFHASSFHDGDGQSMGKSVRIIPVLDLKGGQVVRARRGDRDQLSADRHAARGKPRPVAVADGLRTLYPFPIFYIADLDAIEGRAPNTSALCPPASHGDAPELWVDAGFAEAEALETALAEPGVLPGSRLRIADRRSSAPAFSRSIPT